MNAIRRFFRPLRTLLWNILFGNRIWAKLRLLVLLGLILAYFYFANFLWHRDLVIQSAAELRNDHLLLSFLPEWSTTLIAPFCHLQTARYLLPAAGAVVFALVVGALYVQDIYELRKYRNGIRYLIASLFGFFYPSLEIRDGSMQVEIGEENLLKAIGGPGWVIIRPGNVVLFERLTNPTAVLAEGMHFVPRFEMIKEIVNLRDQHGHIDKISAVTKDGVVVNASDIDYIYRLWAGHRQSGELGRTQDNPYPFSVNAVRNLAYNRLVRQNGLTPWADALRILFEGEIQNYIRRRQLDQITSPRVAGSDPRGEIHRLYETAEFRRRFREIGAELTWYGIGHLDVDEEMVIEQRIATWQERWRGDAQMITAYSDALKKVYTEQARAEAQAEILLAITKAMQDANLKPGQESIRKIVLIRIAQLIESMGERDAKVGGNE